MIPLLSPEEVRRIDRHAVDSLGLPSLALMENAGAGAARVLLERFSEDLGSVVVLGGPGQNGGDAWVVARHLESSGVSTTPILVGPRDKVGGDAATNLDVLEAMGVAVTSVEDVDVVAVLAPATLIVDGLFGTGLDREVTGRFADVANAVNASTAKVLSLDIPSGVHGESGAVLGTAIQADVTVTFAAHKCGLHQHPGATLAGEVVMVSIGVPGPTHDASMVHLLERTDLRRLLPPRRADAHKGSAGRVYVFAGSPGKSGAAVLAGLGALRAGAGLVTLAPRRAAFDAVQGRVTELMTAALSSDVEDAGREALEAARGFDAAVVGPGLGTDDHGRRFALKLCRELARPAVVDADALTALAGEPDGSLADAPAPRVLTPHPGEAARLLGTSSAEVQADRFAAARALAVETRATVVLKGAGTIIACRTAGLRVSPFGTPALATAGTGDVLSGAIAAFLALGIAPFHAASVGVAIHALAGEAAAEADRGTLASEVAAAIPQVLASLTD